MRSMNFAPVAIRNDHLALLESRNPQALHDGIAILRVAFSLTYTEARTIVEYWQRAKADDKNSAAWKQAAEPWV